ncbi:MAG: ammonia-forming cytochrome c nitrite reductase subunit c552 [Pirellulales bacterium]|nr:ammonia-forming cytochrome c nitrite reductase subunit c552 [Pirellulales bacterium]
MKTDTTDATPRPRFHIARRLLWITAALVTAALGVMVVYLLLAPKNSPLLPGEGQGVRANLLGSSPHPNPLPAGEGNYTGSPGCRKCHEEFYRLWATSFHGLAMQPYSAAFAKEHLTASTGAIQVGHSKYRPELTADGGWIVEQNADGEKKFPIAHVMGGKNVYYFLTPLDRGRLQVLPLAYDVHQKKWFDMPASGVRHFADRADAPLDWRHSAYTFNTSCYSCHVSQLSRNYDPETKTYHTVWTEPGINCETCHGPGAEHVRVCESAPAGRAPADLKIISTKRLTVQQLNDSCAPCHAKMIALTATFRPGDRFFDHFDLVTLDDQDFYPDGRDLGENYTLATWRLSPCAQSGRLNCAYCHTSSGRYRFRENPNGACLPCHAEKIADVKTHSFHPADGPGNRCTDCHMPTTTFALMRRTDHSMRPPMPAATTAFGSPNACNLCHADKDAAWADALVRQWRKRDYQAPVLRWAGLIAAARKHDWSRLPEMLAELTRKDREEIVAASLARLLKDCNDPKKLLALLEAAKDPSPLVRAAAVEALGTVLDRESARALAAACGDEYRLVRIRAAAALSDFPAGAISGADRPAFQNALQEYLASLRARPDHWTSHYNLGNYYLAQGDAAAAAAAFESAIELEPQGLPPYLNASVAYARLGRNATVERMLEKAQAVAPDNPAVYVNLGMLRAEQRRLKEAEAAFRTALKHDPQSAVAAYNLSVLLGQEHLDEALRWAETAYRASPTAKYGYNLAFFQRRKGDAAAAIATLKGVLRKDPDAVDAVLLLGTLVEEQGKPSEAVEVYRAALRNAGLPPVVRRRFEEHIRRLESRREEK